MKLKKIFVSFFLIIPFITITCLFNPGCSKIKFSNMSDKDAVEFCEALKITSSYDSSFTVKTSAQIPEECDGQHYYIWSNEVASYDATSGYVISLYQHYDSGSAASGIGESARNYERYYVPIDHGSIALYDHTYIQYAYDREPDESWTKEIIDYSDSGYMRGSDISRCLVLNQFCKDEWASLEELLAYFEKGDEESHTLKDVKAERGKDGVDTVYKISGNVVQLDLLLADEVSDVTYEFYVNDNGYIDKWLMVKNYYESNLVGRQMKVVSQYKCEYEIMYSFDDSLILTEDDMVLYISEV